MKILNSKGSLATTGSRAGKQLSRLGDHPYATAAAVGVAKPAARYEIRDQNAVQMLIRAQRNW